MKLERLQALQAWPLDGEAPKSYRAWSITQLDLWSDKCALSNDGEQYSQMRPTQGVRLVVDSSKIKVSQPVYFDTGLGDLLMVFVLATWNKSTLKWLTLTTLHLASLNGQRCGLPLGHCHTASPEATLPIDDTKAAGRLRVLIVSKCFWLQRGNGTISDESFNTLIMTVESYLAKENLVSDVEAAVAQPRKQHLKTLGSITLLYLAVPA